VPAARWTAQELWSGENLPADDAMTDVRAVDMPPLSRAGDTRTPKWQRTSPHVAPPAAIQQT